MPDSPPLPILIDFFSPTLNHRLRFGGGQKQLLARAVGIKPGKRPHIIDATTGLGSDAWVLASLGCELTLLERSPDLAHLLKEALQRAKRDPRFGDRQLTLHAVDAIDFLQAHPNSTDVVYVDPMFPHRKKSALVKQNMRLLRGLVGDDEDTSDLFKAACIAAKHRVVVKRPRLAPPLVETPKPDLVYLGQRCRFDVYLQMPPAEQK